MNALSDFKEPISSNFVGKNILSLDQFDQDSLTLLFDAANRLRRDFLIRQPSDWLAGKSILLHFNEPSTRTRMSFERAAHQLGASVMIEPPSEQTSDVKGESFEEGMAMRGLYSDAIVMRCRQPETVYRVAQVLLDAQIRCPVINAGNGDDEHPTQALLDLYTMVRKYGDLNDLRIAFVGDLRYGRPFHSLLKGLALYRNVEVTLIPIPGLEPVVDDALGLTVRHETDLKALGHCNVWYLMRTQEERIPEGLEFGSRPSINRAFVDELAGPETLIMHPLPRGDEINRDVDTHPAAAYLKEQPINGVAVRMALLSLALS